MLDAKCEEASPVLAINQDMKPLLLVAGGYYNAAVVTYHQLTYLRWICFLKTSCRFLMQLL
jgi:hypothetical protein